MSNFLYNHVADLMYRQIFKDTSVIKCMLLSTTHTDPDKNFVSEVVANEIAPAAGYVGGYGGSGRKSLGSLVTAVDDSTDRTRFTGPAQLTWTVSGTLITLGTVIASAELVLETGGSDATALLIAHIDKLGFPYTIASASLPFRLILDPNELFAFLKN